MTEPRCDGTIGGRPGPYGFVPVRCGQVVGIARWQDTSGGQHAACIWHVRELEARFPVGEPAWLHEDPAFAPDPIDEYKAWTEAEMREAHGG